MNLFRRKRTPSAGRGESVGHRPVDHRTRLVVEPLEDRLLLTRATAICHDASGNLYLAASFVGVADFDPGPGTALLASGANQSSFVAKYAPSGGLLWAKSFQTAAGATSEATALAVDGLGNVYSTGWFTGTVNFDPGTGLQNRTSNGAADLFVSKLDASGNFVWIQTMGGVGSDVATGLAVDASSHVYLCGSFTGSVDFDPGPGVVRLTSFGGTDAFILKMNSAGALQWIRQLGGASADQANAVAVDGTGNISTTGYFSGTADFDPASTTYFLASHGSQDVFVSKLDGSGSFVWARAVGGASNDAGNAITIDSSGNSYTTGSFKYSADFDPGPGTYTLRSSGSDDIFVWKLSAAGSLVWADQFGGHNSDVGRGIALDGTGDVYAVGSFTGTADFDPGSGTFTLSSNGSTDLYAVKLSPSGALSWARGAGSPDADAAAALSVDAVGNPTITGSFLYTVDFDPSAATAYAYAAGANNIPLWNLTATGAFGWANSFGGASPDVAMGAPAQRSFRTELDAELAHPSVPAMGDE
jgi:hypothetical protein